jgi:hypothetical protein
MKDEKKVESLIRAGADLSVKENDGKRQINPTFTS